MIYPEPGLADPSWIPWWIIPIAALAGMLLLTLLVLLLWAVNHTLYYRYALKKSISYYLELQKKYQPLQVSLT